MLRLLCGLLVLLGIGTALLLCQPVSLAEEKEKPRPKGETFKNEGKEGALARTIDFPTDLGLDLPALATLGGRIDQARDLPDPVCLALAAKELEAAEKASGKKAGIKAEDLEKEAVAMATRRVKEPEIKMIKALVSGEEAQDKLGKALARMKERSKGVMGYCTVVNTSGRSIAVYINDNYLGWVPNNSENSFYVGNSPEDTTKLFARSGAKTWGPRYVGNAPQNYTWNLFP